MAAPADAIRQNKGSVKPVRSFYDLFAEASNGTKIDFKSLQGKKVMLVNVASQCGYTSQYEELEELYRHYKGDLQIIAFPSNDFNGQEPGTDQEIEAFCRVNYNIEFPLAKKGAVIGTSQQFVYQWLTEKESNGWNDQAPTWNFCKYLIDERGVLEQFYPPYVSPLDPQVTRAISR